MVSYLHDNSSVDATLTIFIIKVIVEVFLGREIATRPDLRIGNRNSTVGQLLVSLGER